MSTTLHPPGIVLTKEGRNLVRARIEPSGIEALGRCVESAFLRATAKAPNLAVWISGNAASKRLARRYGLQYRRNRPGAGRPKTPPEAKAELVTISPRLSPAGKTLLDALCQARDESQGQVIEAGLEALKPAPPS